MSAPAPIQPQPQPQPPVQQNNPQPPPININEFKFSVDEKSATRPFYTEDGKELMITIYFSNNETKETKNKRLEQFTDIKLKAIGKAALNLGLGTESKKGKGRVDLISFKQDERGHLAEAEKKFSKGKPTVLSTNHYQEKMKLLDPNDPKRLKLKAKLDSFIKVQTAWTTIFRLAEAKDPAAKKDELPLAIDVAKKKEENEQVEEKKEEGA
jgi:hypothetical protein